MLLFCRRCRFRSTSQTRNGSSRRHVGFTASSPGSPIRRISSLLCVWQKPRRGVYIGFEVAVELGSFASLLSRGYDILLIFIFEALGFSATGDLYINAFDGWPDWPFHQTRYASEVSAAFDYKAERQDMARRGDDKRTPGSGGIGARNSAD